MNEKSFIKRFLYTLWNDRGWRRFYHVFKDGSCLGMECFLSKGLGRFYKSFDIKDSCMELRRTTRFWEFRFDLFGYIIFAIAWTYKTND